MYQNFYVEGLKLSVWVQDQEMLNWVARYLFPLAQDETGDEQSTYSVKCLYDDAAVSKTIDDFVENTSHLKRISGYGRRTLLLKEEHDARQICLAAEDGLVWIIDRQTRSLLLMYSSRTTWPALECARAVRDIVSQFLGAQGWALCHAGAVQTPAGTYMIIGEPGAGKTTFILALLQTGARYIANEMIFIKSTGQGLRAIPFAIPIAIGLGTALQFPAIAELLEPPYRLLYPPRRLNTQRLSKTKREDWPKLKDKLQILPSELIMIYPSASPRSHAVIDAVIAPDIHYVPIVPEAISLHEEDLSDLLLDNLGNERFTAPWFNFGFDRQQHQRAEDLMASVKTLPAIDVSFHVRLDEKQDEDLQSLLAEIETAVAEKRLTS